MECPWWGFFCAYMKENNVKRRFRKAEDGAFIRRWYSRVRTTRLAWVLKLTDRQINNYIYRHNDEPWAKKDPALLSLENSMKGGKGGRPQKKKEK